MTTAVLLAHPEERLASNMQCSVSAVISPGFGSSNTLDVFTKIGSIADNVIDCEHAH